MNAHPNLRMDVQQDWGWSDSYLPEIRRILAQNALALFTIKVATYQQDIKQATDLLVSVSGQKAIAVRLRRAMYRYRDLTIRAQRTSGAPTELEKIKSGYGDYYLYGWTVDYRIPEWMLVDLSRLRATGLLNSPQAAIRNKDARTAFIAISYTTLRDYGCVLAAIVR
ncbi:MAG: hypothetical protein K8L97_01545 [Anaerolineae bacterium]|nr:hypothetical protein [Anaerolineae bacterium]